MTSELLARHSTNGYRDPLLEREVAEFMTPGCVVVSQAASVADAAKVMATHRVHAVLILGSHNGTPLGWVTHRGLLGWIGRDRSLARATEAITEQVRAIPPTSRSARRCTRCRLAAPPGCSFEASPIRCRRACSVTSTSPWRRGADKARGGRHVPQDPRWL